MKRFSGLALCASVAWMGCDQVGVDGPDAAFGDHANDAGADSSDGDGGATGATRAWTFFVYGNGDNNLSNSLARDMAEMASAKLTEDVQVVVFADFDATQTVNGTNQTFPRGAQWFEIAGNGQDPAPTETEAELDFDDPSVLQHAISKAFKRYPSRHRAIVLWDHGGSWMGGFGGDTQDGTLESGSPMPAAMVADAVRKGLADAEIHAPIELFSFDTCLMAGAEVVSEFSDIAQLYIAEAEIDYGDGWNYDDFLTHLAQHPDDGSKALAAAEVKAWEAQHLKAGSDDQLLRSQVALDLPKFGAFVHAYKGFVSDWLHNADSNAVEFGRASYFSLPAYMNQLENPGDSPELRDVGQFLTRFSAETSDTALAMQAEAAKQALSAAILGRSQGSLRETAGQYGVHVELPLASALTSDLLSGYGMLAAGFSDASGWGKALNEIRTLNDGVAPTIQASAKNASNPSATHLPSVVFSASDADLAEAEVDLGSVVDPSNPDDVVFYGVIANGAISPNTQYDVAWDGTFTTLPADGGNVQPVFVRVWEDSGTDVKTGAASASLLAMFGQVDTGDGQPVFGALLFQDGDQQAGLLALFDPAITLSLGEVMTDLPGSTFTPMLDSVSLSTSSETPVLGTPIALDAPSVEISHASAPAGTYVLVTSITDVFGNQNSDVQAIHVAQPIQP